MTAIAVTIAGSDSGGGAGIQADLKTFSALGVYGASVVTALTAQNTRGVSGIHAVPPAFVTAQMDAVFSDLAVDAVKIGMLADPGVIAAVAAGIDAHGLARVVLDPVMVATSGDTLLVPEAIETLRADLLPRATLVTPNIPEAAKLLDVAPAGDAAAMAAQGRAIVDLGARAVLVKGGHGDDDESADVLVTRDSVHWFTAPRHRTGNTHGTGCSLSSAIAAGLARGDDLLTAVGNAKRWLTAAIVAADELRIGHGHGPVHHFHAVWPALSTG